MAHVCFKGIDIIFFFIFKPRLPIYLSWNSSWGGKIKTLARPVGVWIWWKANHWTCLDVSQIRSATTRHRRRVSPTAKYYIKRTKVCMSMKKKKLITRSSRSKKKKNVRFKNYGCQTYLTRYSVTMRSREYTYIREPCSPLPVIVLVYLEHLLTLWTLCICVWRSRIWRGLTVPLCICTYRSIIFFFWFVLICYAVSIPNFPINIWISR